MDVETSSTSVPTIRSAISVPCPGAIPSAALQIISKPLLEVPYGNHQHRNWYFGSRTVPDRTEPDQLQHYSICKPKRMVQSKQVAQVHGFASIVWCLPILRRVYVQVQVQVSAKCAEGCVRHCFTAPPGGTLGDHLPCVIAAQSDDRRSPLGVTPMTSSNSRVPSVKSTGAPTY